jgi:hypothetical protein
MPDKILKPGGHWKIFSATYWVSPSKYGQRYCCRICGKRALGLGELRHNHFAWCRLLDKAREEKVH